MGITEKNFVARLKAGDQRALEYVAEQYGGLIMAVVRKQLAALPDLQQECVNDVLLAVWQHCGSFDEGRSSFANWLAGLCRYKAIDCRRAWLKRVQELPLEQAEQMATAQLSEQVEQDVFDEVDAMLACLKETDRELFRRLFVEGQPVEEVAAQMHIRQDNLYNRVSRGRRRLRQYYAQHSANGRN